MEVKQQSELNQRSVKKNVTQPHYQSHVEIEEEENKSLLWQDNPNSNNKSGIN
jgi:hypothetical protein